MEVTGKIIAVLPLQGGVSKAGNEWKKQEYVLETHDLPMSISGLSANNGQLVQHQYLPLYKSVCLYHSY